MDYDSLIFDLDGTLWDCSTSSLAAAHQVFSTLGVDKQLSIDFIRQITGAPESEFIAKLIELVPNNLREKAAHNYSMEEVRMVRQAAERAFLPGVKEGIIKLHSLYRLFVVSNCSLPYLDAFRLGSSIGAYFEDFECYGRTRLPKSDNLINLIKRNKLKNPCYIGDTERDEIAAKSANIPFFFVNYGFGTVADFADSFNNFTDLTNYFLSPPTP
jgi:phosphoglycolate phosphatase